jgi:hypothetical protein
MLFSWPPVTYIGHFIAHWCLLLEWQNEFGSMNKMGIHACGRIL